MRAFEYYKPGSVAEAVEAAATRGATYLAGGTNLVDLMREGIETPTAVVDVAGLSTTIERTEDGVLILGAGATNTAVAAHSDVRRDFPLIARAILNGASGQIRNMATVGGNLLQRTRCLYFYDTAARCNKRRRGTGCDALEGDQTSQAVLGVSSSCIATHPSDLCVALVALDAEVHLTGPYGDRKVNLADFHRLPGDTPDVENVLEPYELVTAISVPPWPPGRRSVYRKVRERASYAFALTAVAAALDIEDGVVLDARLALGGLATKPWRASEAEAVLIGAAPTTPVFEQAAQAALRTATPTSSTAFKVPLAERTIAATLAEVAALEVSA